MTDSTYQMDIDLGVLCWQLCEGAKDFYKEFQNECSDTTIEIKNETPSEEEQENLRKLIEKKTGYTIEQMKKMKRENGAFELDFDL